MERKLSYASVSLTALEEGPLDHIPYHGSSSSNNIGGIINSDSNGTGTGTGGQAPVAMTMMLDSDGKRDGRLFPEYPLYCEGLYKPYGRGMLHLICSLLIPLCMIHLTVESNGNILAISSCLTYLVTNLWCYGVSGLYHVWQWR